MDKAARMDWDNLHSPDGERIYSSSLRDEEAAPFSNLAKSDPKKVRRFMEDQMTDQRVSGMQIIL